MDGKARFNRFGGLPMLKDMLAMMHPVMRGVPTGLRLAVSARIALSKKHGFLYIRIPKAANSTIVRTLAMHAFPERRDEILGDATGTYAKNLFEGLLTSGCLASSQLQRAYYTFSFFRNPYTRVLSAYLDKIDSNNMKFGMARNNIQQSKGMIDFDAFVTYLEQGGLHANIHWAPQTDICPIPISKLDYVGRIEGLDEGLEYVVSNIFGESAYQGTITRDHQRRHATDKVSSFYNDNLRARVYKLYMKDFEQLGYSASQWT